MSRKQNVDKPTYRFVVYDDSLYTWGVKDQLTGKDVATELRSSYEARVLAEKYNLDPSQVPGDDVA